MQKFQFRLASVLGWRALQLDLEQGKLEALFSERHGIEAARSQTVQKRKQADGVLTEQAVEASQLAALDAHRKFLTREAAQLAAKAADCERRIAAQRQQVLEAERRVRLLERLKQRRLAEWQLEADRELEALASEAFLAKWVREH